MKFGFVVKMFKSLKHTTLIHVTVQISPPEAEGGLTVIS